MYHLQPSYGCWCNRNTIYCSSACYLCFKHYFIKQCSLVRLNLAVTCPCSSCKWDTFLRISINRRHTQWYFKTAFQFQMHSFQIDFQGLCWLIKKWLLDYAWQTHPIQVWFGYCQSHYCLVVVPGASDSF